MRSHTYTTVCPRCGSPDVEIEKNNPVQPALGLPATYVCQKCEYSGYNFPEVAIDQIEVFEEDEGKRELPENEQPLVDPSYGKFQVGVIWKVTSPLFVIFGLGLMAVGVFLPGLFFVGIGFFMMYASYFGMGKR